MRGTGSSIRSFRPEGRVGEQRLDVELGVKEMSTELTTESGRWQRARPPGRVTDRRGGRRIRGERQARGEEAIED